MSGKEVFVGDNSKRTASNNNDLFERWLIRSGGELPNIIDSSKRLPNPQDNLLVDLSSEKQADQMKENIFYELERLRKKYQKSKKLNNVEKMHQITDRRNDLKCALTKVCNFLDEWKSFDSDKNLISLVENNDPNLRDVAKELIQYRNSKKDNPDLWLSDNDYSVIMKKRDKIRDELMRRKLSEPK